MRVYVTGSGGLVGRALLMKAPQKHEIFQTSHNELDLRDRSLVEKYIFGNKIDSVILAAAKVGGIHANSIYQKDFLLENLKIQNSVIEASVNAGVENFIFLGSSCIYPKFAQQPISEQSILTGTLEKTNEGYALAKIAGVHLCQSIYKEEGRNFFSLMPTNLYGPNDFFHKLNSHVPAALMRRFHEAKLSGSREVLIWGTGNVYREFMHVFDLATACWFFLEQRVGGELINIGTGSDISIRKFAELMAEVVGYRGKLIFDNSKPDGAPRKILDISKAKSLGWEASIPLVEGLATTYNWFSDAYSRGEIRGL